MTEVKHTPLPWKMVSAPNFDNGNVYTSIQPVKVHEETMKPLAMANVEHHVCRMSHTAAEWRFSYHRENAAFIVRACNSHYELLDALKALSSAVFIPNDERSPDLVTAIELTVAAIDKAEGRL